MPLFLSMIFVKLLYLPNSVFFIYKVEIITPISLSFCMDKMSQGMLTSVLF